MSASEQSSRSEPDAVEKAFDYYWRAGHFAMHPLGGDPFAALKLWRAAWEASSAPRSERGFMCPQCGNKENFVYYPLESNGRNGT